MELFSRTEVFWAYVRNQHVISARLPEEHPLLIIMAYGNRHQPHRVTLGCPECPPTSSRTSRVLCDEVNNVPDRIYQTVVLGVRFKFVQDAGGVCRENDVQLASLSFEGFTVAVRTVISLNASPLGASTSDARLGVVKEVVDLPRRFRCCMKTRFRSGHHDRWCEDDDSILFHLYKVTIVLRKRAETDPPP